MKLSEKDKEENLKKGRNGKMRGKEKAKRFLALLLAFTMIFTSSSMNVLAATINSLGSDEEGTYSFYEIRFEKDGAELDVKDEHMDIDVTFKDASSAVQVKDGEAKRI